MNTKSDASDALLAFEDHANRRAGVPLPSPKQPSPGVFPCRYYKDRPCHCGARGLCLEVA